MNSEHIKDLLEAYALGALEPHEQKIVEQHLAGCADCRQLAREFEHTASLLPQALAAVSPLRPPESLKERLLQTVQSEPSDSATSTVSKKSATVPPPGARAFCQRQTGKELASPLCQHSLGLVANPRNGNGGAISAVGIGHYFWGAVKPYPGRKPRPAN